MPLFVYAICIIELCIYWTISLRWILFFFFFAPSNSIYVRSVRADDNGRLAFGSYHPHYGRFLFSFLLLLLLLVGWLVVAVVEKNGTFPIITFVHRNNFFFVLLPFTFISCLYSTVFLLVPLLLSHSFYSVTSHAALLAVFVCVCAIFGIKIATAKWWRNRTRISSFIYSHNITDLSVCVRMCACAKTKEK